ncbi:sensor histidine kinase [Occallatibacter savannae]|uniref:sensor histidine kinase n=1 Tax=Occallatibacter savannae TaxID=1002691 RepID=UPI000D691482|nr:sensor histidine kinase [Occallatibacter savannae]
MWNFFVHLFSQDFMPHGFCYRWAPEVLWLNAIADSAITISYYMIPLALAIFVKKRPDVPFHWIFFMFGVFIFGCGTTHLMEVWTIWHPAYRLAGIIKAITAVASAATAVLLIWLIPKAVAIPSPAQLRLANAKLAEEVQERQRLERAMLDISAREQRRIGQDLHDDLGQRLTGIGLMSKYLEGRLDKEHRPETAEARKIVSLISEAIQRTRELARGMAPVLTEDDGLQIALSRAAEDISMMAQLECRFECRTPVSIKDQEVAYHLYYIAQEALNNALRHARPSAISISLSSNDGCGMLVVSDDGVGFEPQGVVDGFGRYTMENRARIIGGTLEIKSGKRQGTAVTCTFPMPQKPPQI